MNLTRVASMGLTEVAGRTRQELWKGLERMELVRPRPRDRARMVAAGDALERFRRAVGQRFFAGAVADDTPALLDARLPAERARVLAESESITRGRFDVLGYRGLSFGMPVDWHRDPLGERRAPLAHWSRLDPLDVRQVGDSKVIWELNRHQWLVRLGQAWRLTGEERYARHFAASLESWLAANPPGRGINWASSLEAALRIVAWSWALVLFRDAPALTPALFTAMVESIGEHARRVERYLSYYFSPNTHLTGEALGLVYAAVLFPELRAAPRWHRLGSQILLQEWERQVLPDGVHFERATCYQRYTAEIYLHFAILSGGQGLGASARLAEGLGSLLDFLLAIRRPDGALPEIGDADGGWLLPLAARTPDDLRGVLGPAAAVCGRADFAWGAGGVQPELVWLLGAQGVKAFESMEPGPPTGAASRLFPEGGYAIMRSGWDARAHHLVFDVGPLGCPVSAGHGHADLLSIQCSAYGEAFVVDPGTYCYTADGVWREFFRGTAAHSTVMVDGRGQAVTHGPFGWRDRPRGVLTRWVSGSGLDVADAEHTAYRDLPDPVVHRRRVLWVARRYWVIVDDLVGADEHRVEARFQFAALPLSKEGPWIRARGARGAGLLLGCFGPEGLHVRVAAGSEAPREGWLSPAYGQRVAAPVVTAGVTARLPLRLATVLYPIADGSAVPPATARVLDAAGELVALAIDDGREIVRFGDREGFEPRAQGAAEMSLC